MSEPTPVRVEPGLFRDAVDVSPEALAIFDGSWKVVYLNPAGGQLLERGQADLIDRNVWSAVPELAGTIFHSFLLHARSVGDRVTWQGYYPPADRWLTATAVLVGELLHVFYRDDPSCCRRRRRGNPSRRPPTRFRAPKASGSVSWPRSARR